MFKTITLGLLIASPSFATEASKQIVCSTSGVRVETKSRNFVIARSESTSTTTLSLCEGVTSYGYRFPKADLVGEINADGSPFRATCSTLIADKGGPYIEMITSNLADGRVEATMKIGSYSYSPQTKKFVYAEPVRSEVLRFEGEKELTVQWDNLNLNVPAEMKKARAYLKSATLKCRVKTK